MSPPRAPVFDNYGGYYHLRIASADDLNHLLSLNDGRWIATSCPRFGLNVDPAFLAFLDADGNGRIVSDEVRSAIRWTLERLRPSPTWETRQPTLPLDLILVDSVDGKAFVAAARRVLDNLQRPDATEISLDEIRNRQKIMAQAVYNGDGVIPPERVDDAETAAFARDLVAVYGGAPDASGSDGVDTSRLDRFAAEAPAYLDWSAEGVVRDGETNPILPFGEATRAMFDACGAVREKVDLFYAQCALVRFDARVLEQIRLRDDELGDIRAATREAILERLRSAPLATPNAEGVLPLDEANEVHAEAIGTFRDVAVRPMFGDVDALSEQQWREMARRFADYERWVSSKPATPLESLSSETIRRYLDGRFDGEIRAMIAADEEVAKELQQVQNLEKLALYHQWLLEFVNNYASFPRLFSLRDRALFEMGTLVLDAREYFLALRIENRAAHANLAKHAGSFLLYVRVTGAEPSETFEAVVPVTRGHSIRLYVGRRGVFFALDGKEYDAEITQIVENPINLWESMKQPIRRIRDLIASRTEQLAQSVQKEAESQVSKVTSRVETGVQSSLQKAPEAVAQPQTAAPEAAPAPAPEAPGKPTGNARDLMIGAGFVVAGLATSVKFLADTADKLRQPEAIQNLLYVVTATVGVFFAVIMAITLVTAWLKLRKRDLGVLLQAGGWAINGRMRVNAKMGRLFVRPSRLPREAKRQRKDLVSSIEKLARSVPIRPLSKNHG